ncbi:hypothetical protein PSTG_09939 [Puccinia striiformis f. sp. tritici PST-78]|uniref:Uncharacterized protein n=1 Tax=Puccinia striiformis f. sp. tritici PST-78 TaxID=1165861 RepID=A0A0L0VC03_9BASI|nr:hypothetical protein PSTG_09939 [Puccinia striiformis f. sp. tritici PST-78]
MPLQLRMSLPYTSEEFIGCLLIKRTNALTGGSVEHCFSAAANTCGRDQGSLAARTIERCVNSHQWLRQGFQADKDFDTAQRIINCATGGVEGSYIPLTECSSSDLDSESDN